MRFRMLETQRSLCSSCRESQIIKHNNGSEVTLCNNIGVHPFVVHRPVLQCNTYREMGKLTQYEAEKIGWVLETKGTAIIGFRPPKNDD